MKNKTKPNTGQEPPEDEAPFARQAPPINYSAAIELMKIREKLIPGRTYALQFSERDKDGKVGGRRTVITKRRYKLIQLYPHIALFTDEYGHNECFGYWELWRRVVWEK